MSAALAPDIGGIDASQVLFPDEDNGAEAPAAPEPDRFALFPDEARLAASAAQPGVAPPPFMFERTTDDRLGPETRTLTLTPRLILLALILFLAAFTTVRSCQIAAAASTASTATAR